MTDFSHGLGTPSAYFGTWEQKINRAVAELQKARGVSKGGGVASGLTFAQFETPPATGGGNGGGQNVEVWQWLVDADKDAGTPWLVDDTDFGAGSQQGFAFNIPQFRGVQVQVGPLVLTQGTGVEAYPHWVWTSATEITIHHVTACTSDSGFAGDLVRVTALI